MEEKKLCDFNYVVKIIEVFLFSLPFTYRENSEIKVTVKLTGSMVYTFCLVSVPKNNVSITIAMIFIAIIFTVIDAVTLPN